MFRIKKNKKMSILETIKSIKESQPDAISVEESADEPESVDETVLEDNSGEYINYTYIGDNTYMPLNEIKTTNILPSGLYSIIYDDLRNAFTFYKNNFQTDKLYELPIDELSLIKNDISKFWTREKKFKEYGLVHKRGLLLYGKPGCHLKGTKILMFNGTQKKVEDIKIGDLIMGDDNTSREVLKLIRGNEPMKKIIPNKGEPFIVNKNHVLSLKASGAFPIKAPINLTVNEYETLLTKPCKNRLKLYRTSIDFNKKTLKIPPYIMGIWLGDGTSSRAELTTKDDSIAKIWCDYGKSIGLNFHKQKNRKNSKSNCYTITKEDGVRKNKLMSLLREYNVLNNKHIPYDYLTSTKEDRLELLAGLMDSDGHKHTGGEDITLGKKYGSNYEILTKFDKLSDDILFLVRSLGFGSSHKYSIKGTYVNKKKVFEGTYHRITFWGDTDLVPVVLEEKKCNKRLMNKDPLITGFKIETLKNDDYYGFVVDKNHLYVMGDFTVTHNCGKSCAIQLVMKDLIDNHNGLIFKISNRSELDTFLGQFNQIVRKIEPKRKVVVIMEDIDGLFDYDTSVQTRVLNLLDGINQNSNILYVATTNFPEKLQERILNRPSRFDKRYEFRLPNPEIRRVYLLNSLKENDLKNIDLQYWIDETEGLSLSHLRELIVSVIILENDFDTEIKTLKDMGTPISSSSYRTSGVNGFKQKQTTGFIRNKSKTSN